MDGRLVDVLVLGKQVFFPELGLPCCFVSSGSNGCKSCAPIYRLTKSQSFVKYGDDEKEKVIYVGQRTR